MANGKEYDEVEAVVRIPKGQRLADSHETKGWSRGFTPKSSDKGPQHVELRLKDGAASPSTREPEVIYVTEDVETPRASELTPAERAAAEILTEIINRLIEVAKPFVAEWWETRAIPAIVAKRDGIVQRRRAHRAENKAPRTRAVATTSAAQDAAEDDSSSQEVTVAEGTASTMTSEQFQRLFVTWLAREDAQRELWHAIVHADIQDDDAAMLEWRQRLKELTPDQRTARVNEFLSANPSILADLGRRFLESRSLEVSEPVR